MTDELFEGFGPDDPFVDFDRDQLRDYVERVHLLEQLTQHPGWPVLRDVVIAKTGARQNRLIRGQVEDFAHYKQMAGWVEGALAALDVPQTQLQQLAAARARLDEHESAQAQEDTV